MRKEIAHKGSHADTHHHHVDGRHSPTGNSSPGL